MAVFTADQVKSLNAFQSAEVMHPFTCFGTFRDERCGEMLIATEAGWVCRRCDYTQDWAHDFMTDWQWAKSLAHMTEMHRKRVEHGLASVGMTLADIEGKKGR